MTGRRVTRCLIGMEENQGKGSTMDKMHLAHPLAGRPIRRVTSSTTHSMCGETTTGSLTWTWTAATQKMDGLKWRGCSVGAERVVRGRRYSRRDAEEQQEARCLSRPTITLADAASSMSSTTKTTNVKLKISPTFDLSIPFQTLENNGATLNKSINHHMKP